MMNRAFIMIRGRDKLNMIINFSNIEECLLIEVEEEVTLIDIIMIIFKEIIKIRQVGSIETNKVA